MSESIPISSALDLNINAGTSRWVRRHIVATLLSTLLPGAGQLFLGRRRSAILLLGLSFGISVGAFKWRPPESGSGMILLFWICLPLSFYAIWDCIFGKDERNWGKMSRWYFLLLLPLSYIGVNVLFTPIFVGSGFRALRLASSSMEPTLKKNEKFVFDVGYFRYHHRSPGRGDIVLLRRPDGLLVKRIVGIPGDIVEGRNQQILLNGELQSESFIQHTFPNGTNPYSYLDTFGPVTVPTGKYFVMGDNRDTSLDSRVSSFGLVDDAAIIGKPLYAYDFFAKGRKWRDLN